MRSLRSQKHWGGSRSVLDISIHLFQVDRVLECVDVDADAALAAQGAEEEDDAGEPPELYAVARYLMPAAMT
jgi:hypothetical protein